MSDEFTLGDDEEFTLGDPADEQNFETAINSGSDDGRISIEKFYETLVEGFVNSRSTYYDLYLEQGSVPATVIYEAAGLEPFATPDQNALERFKKWCDAWSSEAEKFRKTDQQKAETLIECINHLKAIFRNEGSYEVFREALLNSTWNRLDAVIKEKCSDKVVELFEMAGIITSAREMGLFSSGMKNASIEKIHKTISANGAVIEDFETAFKSSIETEIKQDSKNRLDTDLRQKVLAARYCELKTYENQINEIEKVPSKEEALQELPALLKKIGLPLVSKEDAFISESFAEFKKSHDLSVPLSVADFYDLKSKAAVYGFNDEEWKYFAKYNSVKCEEGNKDLILQKETEIAEQQKKMQQLQEEQQKKLLQLQEEQKRKIEASEKKNQDLMARIKELEKKEAAKTEIAKASATKPASKKPAVVEVSEKHRIVALLLLIFFGYLGVHKFYLGRKKAGIFQIFMMVLGYVFMFIYEKNYNNVYMALTLICIGLFMLILTVDFFKILFGTIKDGNGNRVKKW